MNQPLVSVIVVSYNHGRFIRENLESIKRQSYNNIELIVADDASRDNSVECFDMWLSENGMLAKKNYHLTNTGLTPMLNECLKLVEGDFVKIIAADDFLHDNYIENCLMFLVKNKLEAVVTNAYSVDNGSQIISDEYFDIPVYNNLSEMADLLMYYNFVPGSTLFMRKRVFRKVGCYQKDTILEDYNFALRMAKAGSLIGVIRESLVYYRRHECNQTVTRKALLQIELIKEQILFDKDGKYADVIATNILLEIAAGNDNVYLIRTFYKNYFAASRIVMLGLHFPKLYRLLLRFCSPKLRKKFKILLKVSR